MTVQTGIIHLQDAPRSNKHVTCLSNCLFLHQNLRLSQSCHAALAAVSIETLFASSSYS